jgi:hypothetical protein
MTRILLAFWQKVAHNKLAIKRKISKWVNKRKNQVVLGERQNNEEPGLNSYDSFGGGFPFYPYRRRTGS